VISIMITSRFASAQVKEEWVARYGSVHPMALSVDAAGNVYVTGYTGYSTNPFNDSAYATIKYDTNGNELWVARYGPANGYNYASALAVDAEGNVYVTGNSEYDYATIKYDANGNELWVARYYGLADSGDWEWPSAIAVDAEGNVYVTGWSGGYYDFPTANTIKLVPNSSESGDGGGESGGGGGKCFITTIIN
jgi:hypothetical protein